MKQSREPYDRGVTTQPRRGSGQLVSIESQTEFDLLSGRREQRTFLKMYVEARTSGLLAAISDRDWKTLCTLATYMDADGYCFPSQAELAKAMGCSRQMANERVNSLSRFSFKGQPVLLIVKGNRSRTGEWGRNGYRVLPIASLGIFAGDHQLPAPPKAGPDTVSRDLDTGAPSSPTVSSRTVTVPLDTNKNHASNENHSSNIRRAAQAVDNSGSAQNRPKSAKRPRTRQPEQSPHPHDKSSVPSDPHKSTPRASRGKDHTPTLDSSNGRSHGEHEPGQKPGLELLRDVLTRHTLRPEDRHAREAIQSYISDIAHQFGDKAALKSSVTRAYNLYEQSGRTMDAFINALFLARANVKERHQSTTQEPIQNRMSYFFSVLEDQLGLKNDEHNGRGGESATEKLQGLAANVSPPD
jgi:hypothetical protein